MATLTPNRLLWAPRARIGSHWHDAVLLEIGRDGCWASITSGVAAPAQAERLAGPVLPGLVNGHSHAFQRAFAGLAERRDGEHDDFWRWRDRMYRVAQRVGPEALRDIAAQLYVELLHGGYTQVCEFHYLQHDIDGTPYADPGTLAWALADAAASAGIGLTLLPALYERAGFDAPTLRDGQRRFAADADAVLALQRAAHGFGVPCGVAIHSLRAARPESIARLIEGAAAGPIHIHVAEQAAEVEACLAATGARPIEWLARHVPLDARWQLVHATQATAAEIEAVGASGAGIVLCPSTEANLGDGLCDLAGWLGAGVPIAIGSDSQVGRDALEELRWLELCQRLAQRQRNVAADPPRQAATAARLFDAACQGAAAGHARWGFVEGARADLLVIDPASDGLRGLPADHLLDGLVFSTCPRAWRDVMVAGRWALHDRRHAQAEAIGARFEAAMHSLWAE